MGDRRAGLTAAERAVAERIASASYAPSGGENLAERFAVMAVAALRSLPVEQRMEAMGMRCSPVVRADETIAYVVLTPEQEETWDEQWTELRADDA